MNGLQSAYTLQLCRSTATSGIPSHCKNHQKNRSSCCKCFCCSSLSRMNSACAMTSSSILACPLRDVAQAHVEISLGVHFSLDLFLFLPAEKVSCRFTFKPILATLLKRAVNQIPLQLVPSGFESTLPVLRVLFPCPSVNNCHMAL